MYNAKQEGMVMEETEELPSPWWPTKSKASPYNSKLEGDGYGGHGGVQLCGGGWPHPIVQSAANVTIHHLGPTV